MKQQIPTHADPISRIVAFYHKGLLLFGCTIHSEAANLIILLADGEQIKLSISRIILFSTDKYPPQVDIILAFTSSAAGVSLPPLVIPEHGLSIREIAELNEITSDVQLFALLLHLKNSPHKYLQKHDLFYARSAESEAEYRQKVAKQASRQSFLEDSIKLLQAPGKQPDQALLAQLLRELRAILQGEKIEDLQRALKAHFPGQNPAEMRALLGDTLPIKDPPLLESGLPIAFPDDPGDEAMPEPTLPKSDVEAFCIDDEDSRDFDDAISITANDDGFVLGIHVSNLAAWLSPESTLFADAEERVSSMYLASGVVPMLAPQFSEQIFSLKQNEDKAVLSLYASFSKDAQLKHSILKSETIRISRNYSYKEVDRARQQDYWQPFFRIADKLRDQRDTESKAEDRRFIYNLVAGTQKITIKAVDMQSPARRMIEELMILYNRSLANYAIRHQIPMLFRNINRFYDADKDLQNSTAYLDTRAGFHPGIGAEAYLHSTSPIRRFVDLVNQLQINSHLNQELLPLDEDALQKLIPSIERRILQIRETVQRSDRYWLLRYIEENLMHSPLEGNLKAAGNGKYRVELLPWAKQIWLALDAPPGGDNFNFVIYEIDWSKLILKADLIG
jgi:exoribonuclease-2